MRKTLTLSKETLRVLDDEDLVLVAGGGDDSHKTGNSGVCNADKHKHEEKSKKSHCN